MIPAGAALPTLGIAPYSAAFQVRPPDSREAQCSDLVRTADQPEGPNSIATWHQKHAAIFVRLLTSRLLRSLRAMGTASQLAP